MSHDRRILLMAMTTGAPGVLLAVTLLWLGEYTGRLQWLGTFLLFGTWMGATFALRDHVVRPLQTLSNMLAALREGDYSIRARVRIEDARDPLSLAYHEINALEEVLREQRLGAVEASEILRKLLESVDVAIFAFDEASRLRFLNRAAEKLLGQTAERVAGRTAEELRLDDALSGVAPRTLELSHPGGTGRWELRRSVIRQEGMPLQLLVLADLSRALREEERQMWKRIIRVLSHEINNSLTPIKSISGSLQSLLERHGLPLEVGEDVDRGLQVIRGRADALGRFMSTYAKLARLPRPQRSAVDVTELVRRVSALETRVEVGIRAGPELSVMADPDQLEQALINLIRNAVDAASEEVGLEGESAEERKAEVTVSWEEVEGRLHLVVEDNGPGLMDSDNLFVPFYTTKPGGSGIGLVLSRQIAEGHGGQLALENREDVVGARALLSLPLDVEA